MKDILHHLYQHNTLSKAQAKSILIDLAQGKFNDFQIASFMTVFNMRTITLAELQGFREALLELCLSIDLSEFNTLDLCGTGGDGKDTFNISTLTSFIVAGAGEKVAKHGNYGVSSVSGSSNMLEHFGFQFSNDQSILKKQLDQAGICFLHAPLFHPAMKNVGPIRKDLKVKTFFNMLGPLVNPAQPQNQMTGVFSLELARMYHFIFQESSKNYKIIYALDGYDEISLTNDFKIYENQGENLYKIADVPFKHLKQSSIQGGTSIEENAQIFKSILEGNGTEAQNEVVLANATFALNTITHDPLDLCKEKAERSLYDKKGLHAFQTLLKLV
ncbi:anthranilate phosphoribosyltransferase [Flavobacteriaceae bacterium UJ101]|nr:anthranilate phosphoribosyltransferase [Flavobacteriaceae bacterium UJ101]